MALPITNVAYVYDGFAVGDASNPDDFKVNPTIAAGDFKVSTDGGTKVNLATLPVVTPSGSDEIRISLSASEMNGARVVVSAKDVAGAEWQQAKLTITIPTGNTETIHDIQEGDHIESSTRLRINKKGTTTSLVDKAITGSLLPPSVTIGTTESS